MRAHIGTVAALLLSVGASAREIKGGPAILIGHWGSSAAACRGHHRNPDIDQITKKYWSSCSGTACHKTIISHRRTKNGFVLKTTWRVAGEDKEGSFTFDVLAKNVIKQREYFGRPKRRCTQADAIAGIGLGPPDEDPSPGDQTMFSAAYALAVPSVCPHLKVDEDAAKERAEEGKNAWAKSIPDHNASHLDADSILRFQEKEARKAIEPDAKELPSFCARVLSAFGENGRVIPGLIVSKKRLRP